MPLECANKLGKLLKETGVQRTVQNEIVFVHRPSITETRLESLAKQAIAERTSETRKAYKSLISSGGQFPGGSWNVSFRED